MVAHIEPLVMALREQLVKLMSRLDALRYSPVTPELIDEVLDLDYQGGRLSRRLRILDVEGLLNLSALAPTQAAQLARVAVDEIREGCRRREIDLDVRLATTLPHVLVDADQLVEAVRCALDAAIDTIERGGRIHVSAVAAERGVEIRVAYSAHRGETPDVGSSVALLIAHQLVGALGGEVAVTRANESTEVALVLPQSLVARGGANRALANRTWIFPTPSAA